MNQLRRKEIGRLTDLMNHKRYDITVDLAGEIENIRDEEQEAYDNLPEGIQESDRGWQMEEAIDNLDSALQALEDIEQLFCDIEDYLTEAQD